MDANNLNENITNIHNWSEQWLRGEWLVHFNPQKTEALLLLRKQSQIHHPTQHMNNIPIKEVSSHKHLGLIFNNVC